MHVQGTRKQNYAYGVLGHVCRYVYGVLVHKRRYVYGVLAHKRRYVCGVVLVGGWALRVRGFLALHE